jgi:hypothetical protein
LLISGGEFGEGQVWKTPTNAGLNDTRSGCRRVRKLPSFAAISDLQIQPFQ